MMSKTLYEEFRDTYCTTADLGDSSVTAKPAHVAWSVSDTLYEELVDLFDTYGYTGEFKVTMKQAPGLGLYVSITCGDKLLKEMAVEPSSHEAMTLGRFLNYMTVTARTEWAPFDEF